MKTLAITFISALTIICVALAFDKSSAAGPAGDGCLVGKTIVTHDALGRVCNELTLTTNGKEWEETMMRRTSYDGDNVEAVTYKRKDGDWQATTKMTFSKAGETLACTAVAVMETDGEWRQVAKRDLTDLSDGDGLVDDMVFDSKGNLIMKATYVYESGRKVGLDKEEYTYNDGRARQRTSYSWDDGAWQRQVVANVVTKE